MIMIKSIKDMFRKFSALDIASFILAVALLLCFADLPYGYYTIVRVFATIVMCLWAAIFYSKGNKTLMMIAIGIAILFQPFFKIVLDKDSWLVVDVVVALTMLILPFVKDKIKAKEENDSN